MKLSLIIPVLNEEENVPHVVAEIDRSFAGEADVELEIVFVDDGSRDATYPVLKQMAAADARLRVISFSRNFGSHAALLAGFEKCSGDAAAYLAADLQDPPSVLREMLKKWREGVAVVWGTREKRDDTLDTKIFSYIYSSLMRRLALPQMPRTGLDLCLIDRKVIDAVVDMREKNTSIFGLILWSGFSQVFVPYHRQARQRGKSRWTLGKKVKLVVDSFVSFSFFPIRLVTYMGLIFSCLGFAYGLFVMFRRLFLGGGIEGWASLVTLIVALSGVQLLMLGVVAEYLWRTFDESRRRPPFIIQDLAGFKDERGER
ncbi:MAG: glycosyltransferase family 2 protein [Verrucomicrobiaceae bacterium]|nr:glycosyltransferase family 2 protein [Verrucomicrobiaceae bacterium]